MDKVDRASAEGLAKNHTPEELLDLYHDFQFQFELNKRRAEKILNAMAITLRVQIDDVLPEGTPGDRKLMERDGWEVHAARSKRVKWDADRLLRHLGDLGPEIVKLKPTVMETTYKNLDDLDQIAILDAARVVEVGDLKIHVKEVKD